ncbi:unnamed protein product, partial [Laminaria digitata]
VASRDQSKAEAFAHTHDIPVAWGSYEAALSAPEVDSIYLPLPNSLHTEWTLRALQAGKNVLCEKPLATQASDAERVQEAMARTGGYVMEGFMYRHHPQWDLVRQVLLSGRLGELVSMDSWFTFPLDPSELGTASARLGGGALFDVGCYAGHMFRSLAGCEATEVSALRRGADVDTTMQGNLRMASGVLARFECSIEQDERRGARLTGTRATLHIERPWLPGDAPAELRIERDGVVQERLQAAPGHCQQLQAQAFLAACADEERLRWPIEDAVNNARTLDALHEAARRGQSVRL